MKSKKEINPLVKEILVIVLSTIILTLAINYGHPNSSFLEGLIIFFVILFVNYGVKKVVARHYEITINVKPWEIYQFGFKEKNHFKKPLTMIWWPLFVSLFTMGSFWWFPILEFDVKAKPERATRRHGLYRFAEVTDNHIAHIAFWSIMSTLALLLLGYAFFGGALWFGHFAKISIFYALWSLVPISRLDGSKLFFGQKWLWFLTLVITLIFFVGVMFI